MCTFGNIWIYMYTNIYVYIYVHVWTWIRTSVIKAIFLSFSDIFIYVSKYMWLYEYMENAHQLDQSSTRSFGQSNSYSRKQRGNYWRENSIRQKFVRLDSRRMCTCNSVVAFVSPSRMYSQRTTVLPTVPYSVSHFGGKTEPNHSPSRVDNRSVRFVKSVNRK